MKYKAEFMARPGDILFGVDPWNEPVIRKYKIISVGENVDDGIWYEAYGENSVSLKMNSVQFSIFMNDKEDDLKSLLNLHKPKLMLMWMKAREQ